MDGVIIKIVFGKDPKDAMAYYLGMRAGRGEVSAIIHDEKHLHRYGKNRYLIYLLDDDSQTLWKSIDDMPCMLEFDCNF